MKCKKCRGTGNYFKKMYDTVIGNIKARQNKKGQWGVYVQCPICLGTGNN